MKKTPQPPKTNKIPKKKKKKNKNTRPNDRENIQNTK
jgi:hypothetical protein